MSTQTPNIGLTKVVSSETIGDFSNAMNGSGGNLDIIDTKMGAVGGTSLQAQITALNSQISTPTEVTLTAGSGITVPTGGIKCHKVGRVCFVTFNGLTFDSTGNFTISGLPNPISNVFAKAVSSNSTTTAAIVGNYAYINNGSTSMAISVTSGNTNPHYICFCYIMAS